MSKVKVQILDNAPIIIKGEELELIDGQGNVIETTNDLHLCRCGKSKNKPYCDGSHREGFDSQVRTEK